MYLKYCFFRPKLQVPDLSFVPVVSSESHLDDPQEHDGRVRSFPHVRGNWATFIYVKCKCCACHFLFEKQHLLLLCCMFHCMLLVCYLFGMSGIYSEHCFKAITKTLLQLYLHV